MEKYKSQDEFFLNEGKTLTKLKRQTSYSHFSGKELLVRAYPQATICPFVKGGKHRASVEFEELRHKYNVGRRYQWNEISLGEDEDARRLISILIHEKNSGRELTATFGFFLPNGALISRRLNDGLNAGEANDFSIVYYMELNGARYLFTGDLANQSIQFINSDWTKDCRFVKMPHHGSKDPIKLIPLISSYEDEMVSVSTIYNTDHPYPEVIDKYKAISRKVISTDRGDKGYGLIELDFYVTDVAKDQEQLDGDAKILYSRSKI